MLYFSEVWELKMLQTAKVTFRSVKVIGIIWQATNDFLSVFNHHLRHKTYLIHKCFPPYIHFFPHTASMEYNPDRFFSETQFRF